MIRTEVPFTKRCESKVQNISVIHVLCICIVSFIGTTEATLNNSQTLVKHILYGYEINVRPVENETHVTNVSALMSISSIIELDEVTSSFSYVGLLLLQWKDEGIQWDPNVYGGIQEVKIKHGQVWTPELILVNPVEDSKAYGKEWQRITFSYQGNAMLGTGGKFKSSCSINIQYYPFDTQICESKFIPWSYSYLEVNLISSRPDIIMNVYTENQAWTITKTEVYTSHLGQYSAISFAVHLRRNPKFIAVNVLLPLTFLSLLSILVFLLSPESGERISYSITLLLAIAVFFTIISDTLPRNSDPLPLVCYKLLIDLMLSSLVTLVTIWNTNNYHTGDDREVPKVIKQLYNRCCRPITKVQPESDSVKESSSSLPDIKGCKEEPTWKMISFVVDKIAFKLFLIAIILNIFCFLYIIVS